MDTTIQNQHGTFTFIDTAGLRRKSKVEDAIEHYSNLRAEMAVERADVCLILIDARWALPSRTPRWRAWPTRRARAASSA